MNGSNFDDLNAANDQAPGLGWLGHGPLGPPSLAPEKRNWQNVYYALRTGGANPATVAQINAQRAAAAAKAAGTAGLGEMGDQRATRLANYARDAAGVIARQRAVIRDLRARLGRRL